MEQEKKVISEVVALRNFFEFREGQGLKDFHEELKQLTPEEKHELAELAAKELDCKLA